MSETCGRTEVLVDYADVKYLFRCDREAQHFGHHHGTAKDGAEHWWMAPLDADPLGVDEEPWMIPVDYYEKPGCFASYRALFAAVLPVVAMVAGIWFVIYLVVRKLVGG